MADITIQIAELEKQASLAGKYFGKLEETWGRSAEAREVLKKLESFLGDNNIDSGLLRVFSEGVAPGVIYVELPRGARDFHSQAAQLLLECCLSEITHNNDAAWGKWREFGQNIYYGIIEELYSNFVSSKPQLGLVFELAYRQLMLEAAQLWWESQPESVREIRPAVDRRLGLEITGLLRPLRDKLLAGKRMDLGLLEKLTDIGWEAPITSEGGQGKEMACLLHEHNITPWIFSELFYMLYTDQLKSEEEMVWEKLSKTSFSKPEEVISVISGKLPRVSELAAKEILKLVIRRGQELELRINNELSELQRFTARLKKQAQELVEKNNGEMAKTMEAKLSNESLITLSAKVSDNLIQFQRNLFAQLWQIGDMERKEKSLQSSLEKARYLQKMQPGELRTMLSEKTSDPSTDLRQHLIQFKLFSMHIDPKWEEWAQQHAKDLFELFRHAGEEAKGRVSLMERDLQKRNPKDPQFIQLKTELRKAQEDLKALEGIVEEKGGGRLYHVEKIIHGYCKFLKETAEPLMNYRRIAQLVRLWPPLVAKDPPLMRQQELFDEVRFLNDSVKNTANHCIMAAQGKVCSQPQLMGEDIRQLRNCLQKRYGRNVAVMVYDIRGSSLMSAKLSNAEKEREIKNKLGYLIAQVIKQHGGMLIKDTGDGGLAWFGENGPELYEKCFKDLAGPKGIKMRHSIASGAEMPMQPSADSGRLACECGVQMLKTAEKFIQDNYTNYREWFKEAKEREILHEGINYEVLPPEFKALFRLGVGITSGEPGREVTLSFNAAGDIDLCGSLVNDASMLATGRDPMRSLIIMDQGTFFNLLLNTERFEPAYQKSFEAGKIKGAEAWENSLWEAYNMAGAVLPDGNYYFPGSSFEVLRIGVKRPIKSDAQKAHSLQFGSISGNVIVGDDGNLHQIEDRSELKLIYEIKPSL